MSRPDGAVGDAGGLEHAAHEYHGPAAPDARLDQVAGHAVLDHALDAMLDVVDLGRPDHRRCDDRPVGALDARPMSCDTARGHAEGGRIEVRRVLVDEAGQGPLQEREIQLARVGRSGQRSVCDARAVDSDTGLLIVWLSPCCRARPASVAAARPGSTPRPATRTASSVHVAAIRGRVLAGNRPASTINATARESAPPTEARFTGPARDRESKRSQTQGAAPGDNCRRGREFKRFSNDGKGRSGERAGPCHGDAGRRPQGASTGTRETGMRGCT